MKKYWLQRFRQRHPQRWAQLTTRRAFNTPTLPTRFGLGALFTLIIMFVWSANHQLSLGFGLTFFMLVVLTMSASSTAQQLAQLELAASGSGGVFAGDEAVFKLQIKNLEARDHFALRFSCSGAQALLAHLEGYGSGAVDLFVPAPRRGRLALDVLEISSSFPFGLFNSWQWLWLDAAVLVYPKAEGQLPLPYAPLHDQGTAALGVQGEDEFSHLRLYQRGDNLSRVSWKHTGRGQWLYKQFAGTGSVLAWLDFNGTRGDLETRLSQLAQWVETAHGDGLRYGLKLPHGVIEPNRGPQHRQRCLEALALFEEQVI